LILIVLLYSLVVCVNFPVLYWTP